MNQIAELAKPHNGLTVNIGPDAAATNTVYDAIQLTYDSSEAERGRTYGNLQRVQYFIETTIHGAVVVCQVRFSYVTLDVLLNPTNDAHRAILDTLSKQPFSQALA